jgi:RNA polymerase sigma-70 factor (sigma-E family)
VAAHTADDDDFHEFASARAGQLFRIGYLVCGDWHEAEDLVQTTLAKLFVAWQRVKRTESPDAYARKVLMNTYLSQRRLKRSGETPVAEPRELTATGEDSDLRLTLVAALPKLPPRSRAVVVLRYVDRYSIESVAQALGISPAAVKSLNSRGLGQLRQLLGSAWPQAAAPDEVLAGCRQRAGYGGGSRRRVRSVVYARTDGRRRARDSQRRSRIGSDGHPWRWQRSRQPEGQGKSADRQPAAS